MRANSVVRRVARLIGMPTTGSEPVRGGYSGAGHYRVALRGGKSVFVKVGETPWSAAGVRREAAVYEQAEWSFAPRLRGVDLDDPPLIVLEDLTMADWPPPWTAERIDRVRSVLRDIAGTPPPSGLGRLAELRDVLMRGWSEVAADPDEFLALGLCSRQWLEAALPTFLAAQEAAVFDGDALAHFDVRSDNVCFLESRTVLVDWGGACLAHPSTDLIKWLPSLHAEGGPQPEAVLPDAPSGAVAILAGFWAANAGREPPPFAPRVRDVQRRQLTAALPWAARTLGLPAPEYGRQ
jgi:hypothetical protein